MVERGGGYRRGHGGGSLQFGVRKKNGVSEAVVTIEFFVWKKDRFLISTQLCGFKKKTILLVNH